MQQYNNTAPPTAFSGSSDGGYGQGQGVNRGPSSASSAGLAGRGANMHPSEGYGYLPPAAGGAAAAPMMAAAPAGMSAKQREAFQHSQNRMRIHNEEPSGSGGYAPMSPTDTTSGEGVTVHMDGGEYNDEAPELGKEVPPT